ncbi:cilia- and flagella-associated protein 58-like [Sabethes cyaneus]|uniref:cilia- and flagella-associated protein 58-like n=1 Tax=Sabethes cyaneus TaxID=53552 RepID=UPI00237EE6A0|nr:cilia- and flagella-associated protein 58-like [Sabethes cyaneus]
MGKDGAGSSGTKRPVSASPYAENYRVPMDMCQRHLINHRLMVSKLTRKELEDKYINLCDEHFTMKKRFQEQELQVKKLKAKLLRLSSETSKETKTRSDMLSSQSNLHILEIQRRELHEKLEALRMNVSKENLEKPGKSRKKTQPTRSAKDESTTRSSSVSNEYDRTDDGRDDTSTEDEPSTSKNIDRVKKLCHSCETMKLEMVANESEFVKMKMNIKFLNKEIQHEKEKNALLSRQLEEKLSYEIMRRNAVENIEVINLTRQLEDMHQQVQRQQETEKRAVEAELAKQTELEAQVRKEKDKNAELFDECERLKKNIEKLKEHMSEVEIERDFLKRQQEGLAKIVDENKVLRFQLEELRKHNDGLTRQIDMLKEEESVAKSAQKELLEKLKSLQQDNDTLSVLLEGLRTENEVLSDQKTALEENLKSLEASPAKEISASPQRSSITKRSHSTSENESDVRRNSQKHVRISQVMNKIELLEQNSKAQGARISNAALLVSNKSEQIKSNLKLSNPKLQGTFESYGIRQTPIIPLQDSIITASSTLSVGKKRISFQPRDVTADIDESLSSTQDNDSDIAALGEVQHNYADYFGLTPASRKSDRLSHYLLKKEDPSAERLVLTIKMVRWQREAFENLLLQMVQCFYVELVGFLDAKGYMLETPVSRNMLANETSADQLEYRFDHPIEINLDKKKHANRRKMLREMLQPNGKDVLKFILVQEQESDCSEIGYATIRLRNEIQGLSTEDSKIIDTAIYSMRDPAEEMGKLLVELKGIQLINSLN